MQSAKNQNLILAMGCIFIAMIAIQSGASLAKGLFPAIGPSGTTALRLVFSCLILALLFRPWRFRPSPRDWRDLALYGVALGAMNFLFYLAIQRIPLGLGVALEFIGPLGLALLSSRQKSDWLWVVLAALGVVLILPVGEISGVDLTGALLAVAAGLCWAFYILCGQRLSRLDSRIAVSYGMFFAMLVALLLSSPGLSPQIFDGQILILGLVVAIFSSAIPYSLEMVALRRLPTRTFSILMSLEPVFAAVSGWLFLQEKLTLVQSLAILAIMAASMGAAWSARSSMPQTKIE